MEIFELRNQIADQIAQRIYDRYGFRYAKCFNLAVIASWWQKNYTLEELQSIDIDQLTQEVFREIDNDDIF